jgi:uncharacterized membrane protein YeaQ/YmgE (transglycosylase-associated protein family)
MAWITWVLLGTLAGVLARFPITRSATAVLLDVVLGVSGACLGGWLVNTHMGLGVMKFTLNSELLAMLGAVVAVTLYHSIVYHSSGSTRR